MISKYTVSGQEKTAGQVVRGAAFHYNSLAKNSKHPESKRLNFEMGDNLMKIAEKLDRLQKKLDEFIGGIL